MDHVAIMNKSWELLPKILDGRKKIESRWYLNKSTPWGKIKKGEKVYFKNSGEPITVSTRVNKVLSFENLTPKKVKDILNKYSEDDGIEKKDEKYFYERFKNKKYCLLIFLENPRKIRPFKITKKGFGAMAAWLCVDSIEDIKIRS